jgi:hypothetical protein
MPIKRRGPNLLPRNSGDVPSPTTSSWAAKRDWERAPVLRKGVRCYCGLEASVERFAHMKCTLADDGEEQGLLLKRLYEDLEGLGELLG